MAREGNRRQGEPGIPGPEFIPLSEAKRREFPHSIYQTVGGPVSDRIFLHASFSALTRAQAPFMADIQGEGAMQTISIRTKTGDPDQRRVEEALFLGLTEATRRSIHGAEDSQQAPEISERLLHGLIGQPDLFREFEEYYSTRRMDQERLIRQIFTHGTDFNKTMLDRFLRGQDVPVPYELSHETQGLTAQQIFARFPQFDYSRLEDDGFAASDQGRALHEEYAQVCGQISARLYGRYEGQRIVTDDGREYSIPQIPLSRHPIIEALLIEEATNVEQLIDNDYHASIIARILFDSDSEAAHEAVVNSLTTRLPIRRSPGHGPREFQRKGGIINTMVRKYREVSRDEDRRFLLGQDTRTVLEAYAGNGELITGLREEAGSLSSDEVHDIREVVQDILPVAFASPDREVTGLAQTVVASVFPEVIPGEVSIVGEDPLRVTRVDVVLALFDSFHVRDKFITIASHSDVFGQIATRIFGDPAYGELFQEMAATEKRSDEICQSTDALRAFAYWQSFNSIDKREREAYQAYLRSLKPADALSERVKEGKHSVMIEILEKIALSGQITDPDSEVASLFDGLVKRIDLGANDLTELPDEYHNLMSIAKDPALPERQRSTILWHFAERFSRVRPNETYLLAPVVIDMYEAALGPVDAIRMPTSETSFALGAAEVIVRENRSGIFQHAPIDIMETLEQYRNALREHTEQIVTGHTLSDGDVVASGGGASFVNSQREMLVNLGGVAEKLDAVNRYYGRYLDLEQIKREPAKYYPWVLGQLRPFMRKLQMFAEPGYQPNESTIELHDTVRNLIATQLVRQDEYPGDFDIINSGHIDILLKEVHDRLVISQDIRRHEIRDYGLRFLHAALVYLPEPVREQIIAKYEGDPFVDYAARKREAGKWAQGQDTF